MDGFKISEISKATNIPPSTVRAYERFGFIEQAKREENGYRVFNKRHIAQAKICRLLFKAFISKEHRKLSLKIIDAAVRWDIPECKRMTEEIIKLIEHEIQKAHEVFRIIKNWDSRPKDAQALYSPKQTAAEIGVTKETIRNWERNGLFGRSFERYEKRLYTEVDIQRMKIIKMLRQIGYSLSIILKFFMDFDKNKPGALQVLIDPGEGEDINEACDRWLKKMLAAKNNSLAILEILEDGPTKGDIC